MVLIGAGLCSFIFFTVMYPSDAGKDEGDKETVIYKTQANVINVTTPQAGDRVQDPVTVKGQARGYWFSEGAFPILIIDSTGYTVGEGNGKAEGQWLTTNFVEFSGSIPIFSTPRAETGIMRLRRGGPSSQSGDYVEVPVTFTKFKAE